MQSLNLLALLFVAFGVAQAVFIEEYGCNQDLGEGINNPPLNGGKEDCPLDDPNYYRDGVTGTLVDNNDGWRGIGRRHNLYHFFPTKGYDGANSAEECKYLCNLWPMSPKGKQLSPTNGQRGLCSHWSWNGVSDCYLFGCGICNSDFAFNPTETFKFRKYVSGGGPGLKYCASGVKGDPHYTGADNSHFDFTGIPDRNYCLISDSHLHVNVYYGGRYGQWGNRTHKPMTWIRKVGILWGHHNLKFEARSGPEWRYRNGYMQRIEIDGNEVVLAQEGESISYAGGKITIKFVAAKRRDGDDEVDIYDVTIQRVLYMRFTLRPEVRSLRTATDGVVHFNLEFPEVDLSESVHGVLGQTYRSDHSNRLSQQKLRYDKHLGVHMVPGDNAEGFLDGTAKDYESSNLMSADCSFSRFARATAREDETARAIETSFGAVLSTTRLAAKRAEKVLSY